MFKFEYLSKDLLKILLKNGNWENDYIELRTVLSDYNIISIIDF